MIGLECVVNFGFGSDDEEPQVESTSMQEPPKKKQFKQPNLTLDIQSDDNDSNMFG